MLNFKLAGFVLAGSIAASSALAQTAPASTSPAPATSTAAVPGVPANDCAKPTPLSDVPSQPEVKKFNAQAKVYQTCVQAYVNARRDDLNKYEALAKANAAAANAAIKDFNAFVKALQAKTKAKGKNDKNGEH